MDKQDVITKLLASEGNKSLQFEKQVFDIYETNNWRNIHSPYFQDKNTMKLRELDILSMMRYHTTIKKDTKLTTELIIATECKSLSNYHIICDAKVQSNLVRYENHKIWLGYDNYDRYNKVIEILNKTKLKKSQKIEVINYFGKILFPKDSSIFSNLVSPAFPDIEKFSTFRETNIGNTKDLDNSVLWKSFLSLNSACEGYDIEVWDNIESDLLGSIEYILAFNCDLKKTLKRIFIMSLLQHSSIHKVLVIDAKIWDASNKISPLKYFRLIQNNVFGHTNSWIDVVNINYAEEYISSITKYYTDFFRNQEMHRFM